MAPLRSFSPGASFPNRIPGLHFTPTAAYTPCTSSSPNWFGGKARDEQGGAMGEEGAKRTILLISNCRRPFFSEKTGPRLRRILPSYCPTVRWSRHMAFHAKGPLWSRPGLVCDGREDANGWTTLCRPGAL
jgi:hypothetical protein